VEDRPKSRSCGKMNHIQWVRFRAAFSSSRTVSRTGSCAVTNRSHRSRMACSMLALKVSTSAKNDSVQVELAPVIE
jgi:hypothetical protein